jgi:hypothetical protein
MGCRKVVLTSVISYQVETVQQRSNLKVINQRGQARLPNLELIRVELLIGARKAFNMKAIVQVQEARGREGGLAPAGLETMC